VDELRADSDRELFDSVAEHYSAKDLAAGSRLARRRRLEQTIAAVPGERFERVLEVGCGAGFGAEYLRGRFDRYVGIDHSQRLIEVAREKNSGAGIRFEVTSIEAFEPPSDFDLIFMIGVLHHLEMPSRSLKRMVQWLRGGGHLAANEPQPANPLIRIARRARMRHDSAYSSDQVEFSVDDLRSLFQGAGLEKTEISAQGFLSTPFAEVVLRPDRIIMPLARAACAFDEILEKKNQSWTTKLSWNLIVRGTKGNPVADLDEW
jgi:SAM-dependent methyltransferase